MNEQPQLSSHISARQPSAIRVASIKFAERTDGAQAINLAIGNVSLPMHPRMVETLAKMGTPSGAFSDGVVRYTPTVGTDNCRSAIKKLIGASLPNASQAKADKLCVQVTDGGSQAMELMILACCGPAGSSERPLMLIDAAYTNYSAFAQRLGRKVVSVRRDLTADGGFPMPGIEALNAAFEKHRPGAVVIIPYDNPTGALYRKEDLIRLSHLCVKHNAWIVSDEAYRELLYSNEQAPSIWDLTNADVPGLEGRRLGIETASKVWNACGIRIGALVTDNEVLHQKCVAENTASLCPNALGQELFASLAQETESELHDWFGKQREYYKSMLTGFYEQMTAELPEAIVSRPEASLYSVVDVKPLVSEEFQSLAFVQWCATQGGIPSEDGTLKTLLTAPMTGFYDTSELSENPGRTQFRFAFVESPTVMAEVPALFSKLLKTYLVESGMGA